MCDDFGTRYWLISIFCWLLWIAYWQEYGWNRILWLITILFALSAVVATIQEFKIIMGNDKLFGSSTSAKRYITMFILNFIWAPGHFIKYVLGFVGIHIEGLQ
jgi:hypothetical protein